MKKVLLVLIITLMTVAANAQTSDGKYPVYCDVVGYCLWNKVTVQLDLGRNLSKKRFDTLYGEDGKQMKFNTMVDVLNYMGERGWRVINSYYVQETTTDVHDNTVHYLMEKRVASNDEITIGLNLKEVEQKD